MHLHRAAVIGLALVAAAGISVGQPMVEAVGSVPAPTPVPPAAAQVHLDPPGRAPVACRAGLVALTFDDGPSAGRTDRLLAQLRALHVPATFFVVGHRAKQRPDLVRRIQQEGHTVANHSWSHPQLTHLDDAQVRRQLRWTRAQLRAAGVEPSRLMRPPYGDINRRVRGVVRAEGMVPVLWTADSRDWTGGNPAQIAHRVLRQLRPHQPNIVLQHDGVDNSWASVKAVPQIVRVARAKGYCFAALDDRGRPTPPVPVLDMAVTPGRETGSQPVVVQLRLREATSRPVSVVLRTVPVKGGATLGVDVAAAHVQVTFPRGARTASVRLPVVDDHEVEGPEALTVQLESPVGLRPAKVAQTTQVLSDDRPGNVASWPAG